MDTGLPVAQNIDWLYYLRQGKCFFGGTTLAASVGNVSIVQLFNPVASGLTILLRMYSMSVDVAGAVVTGEYNVALTTNAGNVGPLLFGGAAPVGQIRTQNPVGNLGGTRWPIDLLASTVFVTQPDWYALLPAGQGFNLQTLATNTRLRVGVLWAEF